MNLALALALLAALAPAALATTWPPPDRALSEDEQLQSALSAGVWIGRFRILDTRHAWRSSPELEPYVEAEPIQWLSGGCAGRRIVLYASPADEAGLDALAEWTPLQRSSAFVMVYVHPSNGRLHIERSPFAFHGGCFPLTEAERPAIEARVRRAAESLELEALARRAKCVVIGSCHGVVPVAGHDRTRRGYSIAIERSIAGDAGPGPLVVLDPLGWRPDSTRRLIFLGESDGGAARDDRFHARARADREEPASRICGHHPGAGRDAHPARKSDRRSALSARR